MGSQIDKQEMFCQQYAASRDLNGTQAAIRAGYAEKSADVEACRLLGNAKVQARIAEIAKGRMVRLNIDQDKIVQELSWIVFTRLDELVTWEYWTPPMKDDHQPPDELAMRYKPSAELTEGQRASIEGMKIGKYGPELKMKDAASAIKGLMAHIGMASDKIKVDNEFIGMTQDDLLHRVSAMLVSMPQEMALQAIADVVRRIIDVIGIDALVEQTREVEDEED